MTSEKTEYEKGFEAGIVAGVEVERISRPPIKWPTLEQIKDVAKHEDSDGYFGFLTGCEWLKSFVEKGNSNGV